MVDLRIDSVHGEYKVYLGTGDLKLYSNESFFACCDFLSDFVSKCKRNFDLKFECNIPEEAKGGLEAVVKRG